MRVDTSLERTWNAPMKLKRRDSHETQIEEELRKHRMQVEERFNISATNKSYAFPRAEAGTKEILSTHPNLPSTECIHASIYDDPLPIRQSETRSRSITRKEVRLSKKSRSQEKKVDARKSNVYTLLRKLLHPVDPTKLAFHTTKRTEPRSLLQSSLGKTMQRPNGKLCKYKRPKSKVSDIPETAYATASKDSFSGSAISKKIMYLKKRLESTSVNETRNNKSRVEKKTTNFSDYFKNAKQKNDSKNRLKVIIKQTVKDQLNNTISLSNYIASNPIVIIPYK